MSLPCLFPSIVSILSKISYQLCDFRHWLAAAWRPLWLCASVANFEIVLNWPPVNG